MSHFTTFTSFIFNLYYQVRFHIPDFSEVKNQIPNTLINDLVSVSNSIPLILTLLFSYMHVGLLLDNTVNHASIP